MNYLKSALLLAVGLSFASILFGNPEKVALYGLMGLIVGLLMELFFWNRRRRGLSEGEAWIRATWYGRLITRIERRIYKKDSSYPRA
jgi:PAS domain-containing protein